MNIWLLLLILFIISILVDRMRPSRKNKKKARTTTNKTSVKSKSVSNRPNTNQIRDDNILLKSKLKDISGHEFEQLMTLYFKDNGFKVKTTGFAARNGHGDGGVDLVLIDKKGEKTAVQLKCTNSNVPVQKIRELVGAKYNHGCVKTMFITTSNFTKAATEQAEHNHMLLWNGLIVEQKLKKWGKYQGFNNPI